MSRSQSMRKKSVYSLSMASEAESAPLVVVSNRLPFVLKRDAKGQLRRYHSAGGLVTALSPIVQQCGGLWIGWPGSHDVRESDPIPEPEAVGTGLPSQQVKPVIVQSELFDSFYNGCCNGTFWPLFHSMPDRAIFSAETWKAYQEVNEEFAIKTVEALRQVRQRMLEEYGPVEECLLPVPVVWIHDYQLMLAASMIRQIATEEMLPCKLGFFLHIPFPSWDIMRLFPWDDQILEGILACDLVGFHIEDYCANFIDCCQRRLGCRVNRSAGEVEFDDRKINVRALPIGIPFGHFEQLALKAPKVIKDEKVVLGVDRLDYTKGLVHRIRAFERLLETHPEHIEKVVFIQIAVPSRTDVKEYKALKEEIDQLVGRINGRFSTASWSPIRYIFGCVSQEKLSAFYRDAAVALVTPLRDGMNLVAKEFVACQINETGVLILSPFAGAGGTMKEALLVNPYEIDSVANTIHKALTLDEDERRNRMQALRRRECTMDVDHWMDSFLREIDSVECAVATPPPSTPTETRFVSFDEDLDHDSSTDDTVYQSNLADYLEDAGKLNILLDYDGTLAPIANHPDLAVLPEDTRAVLKRLSLMPGVSVCVMSGRSLDNLRKMVAIDGITYAASQGLEILYPDGSRFIHPVPSDHQEKLQNLSEALQKDVCQHGAWVENKGALLTYHYRAVESSDNPAAQDGLIRRAVQLFRERGCQPHHTEMAIEARPPVSWDKGRAALHITRTTYGVDWPERVISPESLRIVFAGHDDTDEDVIEAFEGLACTFRVSAEPLTRSSANYRLSDPDAVLALLRWIEVRLDQMPAACQSPITFTASFSFTCLHSEVASGSSDEERSESGDAKTKRKRRRSSRSSVVSLSRAAGVLHRTTTYRTALGQQAPQVVAIGGQ